MRLYLTIQRHELPDTRILFNTSSRTSAPGGHSTIQTISDLLSAIDTVVPLEADNAWGLEDYTVELHGYECLHFNIIDDVLKEGDEVLVRGLTSEELKERRLGGRLQISADGRHLIDGTSWGRRWRGGVGRPEVDIPPRKRRRLNDEARRDIEDGDDVEVKQLEWIGDVDKEGAWLESSTVLKNFDEDRHDDDDDDDDEDYHEESEGESEDDEDNYSTGSEQQDIANEGPAGCASNRAQEHKAGRAATDIHAPLEIITEADFDDADASEESDRASEDDREHITKQVALQTEQDASGRAQFLNESSSQGEKSFVGFSSPVRSSTVKTDRPDVHDASTPGTGQDADSSSDSSSDTSQRDSSDSSSDSDISDSVTSPDDVIRAPKTNVDGVTALRTLEQTPSVEAQKKPNVPPGEGLVKTHRNNERKKRSRLLARLKAEGVLPQEADFKALHRHLNPMQAALDEANEVELLESRKEEIMSRLEARMEARADQSEEIDATAKDQQTTNNTTHTAEAGLALEQTQADNPMEPLASSVQSSDTQPSQRRTRLDIASSRRMVLNSLGVRVPQTPAAESTLREKLAEPFGNVLRGHHDAASKKSSPNLSIESQAFQERGRRAGKDLWRRRIIISAVECVYEGRRIEVPSFPFKHPWQIRKEKEQGVYQEEHDKLDYDSQGEQDYAQLDESAIDIDTVATDLGQLSQAPSMPRTMMVDSVDQNEERVVVHDGLPALRKSDVAVGAKLAYKELHMNSRYEPEESPYRVVTVQAMSGDVITVRLSLQDRQDAGSHVRYDEETGERIYSKFDMPEEEEEIDDGVREVGFEQMIQPKLIHAGLGGLQRHEHDGTEAEDFAMTMRSPAEAQKQISTPRQRKIANITRDAGFASAINQQILQPMTALREGSTAALIGHAGSHHKNALAPVLDTQDSARGVEISSPPSESIVESVRYPRLSSLDPVSTSSAAVRESLFQEAQHVDPAPILDDPTMLTLTHVDDPHIEATHNGLHGSLASEIPASLDEVQQSVEHGKDDVGSGEAQDSLDDHIAESESVDSAGFPSLRSLTSSQAQRRSSTSPPPLNRSKGTTSRRDSRVLSNGGPSNKASVSQQASSRLSQVSDGASIVNLVLSSPSKDVEYGQTDIPGREAEKGRGARGTASSQPSHSLNPPLDGLGTSSLRKRTKKKL